MVVEQINPRPMEIRHKRHAPKYYTCPQCGVKSKRVRKWTKRYRDISFHSEAYLDVTRGTYHCRRKRRGCGAYFVNPTPWAPKGGHYSTAVHEMVIQGLVRDRMSYLRLQRRMEEDFLINLSLSTMFRWFNAAAAEPDFMREFEAWTARHFSGVVCIDEVYEGKLRIFIATDCLADIPLCYMLCPAADDRMLDRFLGLLEARGLTPVVAITDGSSLYKASLCARWKGLEHQLCIFHMLKGFNEVVVAEVRATRRALARQGNKGRKRKPGRPPAHSRRMPARKVKSDEAAFVWDHQFLLVKKRACWSPEDREAFARLCRINPGFRTLSALVEAVYGLFERGITQRTARLRRTRLLNRPDFQRLACYPRVARMIAKPRFEKMIVFLKYDNLDRTSNHVERTNRSFRMVQKTRYKRRTERTIENALRHEWMHVLRHHPLYVHALSPPGRKAQAKSFAPKLRLRKPA